MGGNLRSLALCHPAPSRIIPSLLRMAKGYFVCEYLQAGFVTMLKNQAIHFATDNIHRRISIRVLQAYHRPTYGANGSGAPASSGIRYSPKARFVLKQDSNWSLSWPLLIYFGDYLREFSFHSIWASLSVLVLRLSGASLRQP